MPIAHAFGATNEPNTCLWCGNRLKENKTWTAIRRETKTGLTTDDVGTPNGLFGWEGNGFFCTLRCGEEFGKAMARNGHRFEPLEDKEE